MSKGYFWDEAVTILFKRCFSSSLDFPVFKIGLFQNGFFKKKIEAMSKGYFWDEPLTIFLKDLFSSSLDLPVFKNWIVSKWIFQKKNLRP